jgi:hypothetical protein
VSDSARRTAFPRWLRARLPRARPRRATAHRQPGTRAYLSAGLPGADWWVAGAAVAKAEDADVDLDEVGLFCTEHGLWPGSA